MEFQTAELTLEDMDNVSGGCPQCATAAALAALAAIIAMNNAVNKGTKNAGTNIKSAS
jgi:hypothetical protein